jgi:hypothetical protein
VTSTTPDNAESRDVEPPKLFHVESYAHHLLQTITAPAGIQRGGATSARRGARADGNPNKSAVLDAIVVPTVRSAEQLKPAVGLASQLQCQLIAVYTDSFPDGLSEALTDVQPGRATALALRSDASHRLLDLGSAIPQSRVSACAVDISRKRNLGLLIGRSCGWTRMLFLDDDIRKFSGEKVSSAAVLLSQYHVVGLQVTGFPDASVVGHARRMTGSQRRPFISGGSMLVNPQHMRGFFPPVYHEDWLCIMDHLRLGEVAATGKVAQLRYQLFTTAARAQLEEFGDILASGLLWLVHAKRKSSTDEQDYWGEATKQKFWSDILQQRATLLDYLSKRLELIYRDDRKILPLESIQAARKRCEELSPDEFVSFIEEWTDSLAKWRTRLSCLPHADSVAKALAELGLLDVLTMYDERRSQEPAAPRRISSAKDVTELLKLVYLMLLRVPLPGLRRRAN